MTIAARADAEEARLNYYVPPAANAGKKKIALIQPQLMRWMQCVSRSELFGVVAGAKIADEPRILACARRKV
jgi:hypothetical protein